MAAATVQQLGVADAFVAGPPASQAYWSPLIAAVHRLGTPTGRIEIPQINGQWDAEFVADAMPLARGDLRQIDIRLNAELFYEQPPSASAYRRWLHANAVQYVAVPDAALTIAGHNETATIARQPAYLHAIWHNPHWTLYAVRAPAPIIAHPGRLLSIDASKLTLTAPPRTTIAINLRWFPWLSLQSSDPKACIQDTPTGHIQLQSDRGGSYILSSALLDPTGHCPNP